LTFVQLRLHGFHFHRAPISRFFTLFPFRPVSLFTKYKSSVKHVTYWHRPHTSKTKLPVVFIHGIGIGLYPYTKFLNELNSTKGVESTRPDDQVGILALEIMPVSFRLTHAALGREALCDEIEQIIMNHFGPSQKFVLVSHSYGTVITTHLLTSSLNECIGPIVLIDPVSILLHLPDVAYNFTRRKPSTANELQLHYFASLDMGVSHTLSRHFFWSENILWKEDLDGRKVTVSLGGRDLIVDTAAVGRYLCSDIADSSRVSSVDGSTATRRRNPANGLAAKTTSDQEDWKDRAWLGEGTDVVWWNDLDHAQVFDKPQTRKKILNIIRTYCKA
jgi:pimeloyl-ACP methyl ester carboxylesterase